MQDFRNHFTKIMDWSKIEVILFYFLILFRHMVQLTSHQIHSIEDKIHERFTDSQIAQYIHKDRSVISRLFIKYPRGSFDADIVIADRLSTKGNATKQHARIEP